MPSLRTLDAAAKAAGISRRLLEHWLTTGRIKGWKIEGDRKRYVDLEEIKKLREPRQIPPKNRR